MSSPRLGFLALACAFVLSACGHWPGPRDAVDPRPRGPVGRPVLELVWRSVVHDRRQDYNPQEFAGVAFYARPAGDMLFVGTLGGDLLAIDAGSGKVQWKHRVGAVGSRPIAEGGTVIVGTEDGALVALDTWNGREKWRYATRGAIQHAPLVWHDLLIFANDADKVYAIERSTGKWRWQYERDTPEEFTVRGHAGVTVEGDMVYAGFADGNVVALSAATGDATWIRSLAGATTQFVDVDTTPVVQGGLVFAASVSGGFYALDVASGAERWRVPVTGVTDVTFEDGRLYVAAAESGLIAYDLGGHELWRQGLARAGDPARPLIDGNYLFVATATAGLFVVDKKTGALVQSWNPGDGITSQPTVAGSQVYILSNGGVLYALNVHRF
jgi:outer membrane protein assembly factor BamB